MTNTKKEKSSPSPELLETLKERKRKAIKPLMK